MKFANTPIAPLACSRRILLSSLGLFTLIASGCAEPNYRNEVITNAQGGVEVHRVAKDPGPSSPAPIAPEATKPAASQSRAPASSPRPANQSIDERIANLEGQINKLNQELTKLQLQKAASQ